MYSRLEKTSDFSFDEDNIFLNHLLVTRYTYVYSFRYFKCFKHLRTMFSRIDRSQQLFALQKLVYRTIERNALLLLCD